MNEGLILSMQDFTALMVQTKGTKPKPKATYRGAQGYQLHF